VLLVAPASFFAGMTLPVITYIMTSSSRDEKYTGIIYGWNTIGSIVGATLGGLVLLPALQLRLTFAVGAGIDMALGIALLVIFKQTRVRIAIAAAATAAVILPVLGLRLDPAIIVAGQFRYYTDTHLADTVIVRDGRTATISLHTNKTTRSIKTNGKADASLFFNELSRNRGDEPTQAALALIALPYVNKPYDAAIIGMGSGMSAHHLLADPLLRTLDLIEIEPEVIRLARHFMPYNRRVYEDPRVRFRIDDAKTFFASQQRRYGLIISEPSNPWVSGVSNLFTVEFYRHVAEYLQPDGRLVQWAHLYEFDSELLLTIIKAVDEVFPSVNIYMVQNTEDIIIVASRAGVEATASRSLDTVPSIRADKGALGQILDMKELVSLMASTASLRPILKYVNPNSDFYPLVDNGAEKSFFMKTRVNLFDPFNATLSDYQEILDPATFAARIAGTVFDSADGRRLQEMQRGVHAKMQYAESPSDWEGIDAALYDVLLDYPRRLFWDTLSVVREYREQLVGGRVPEKNRLRFRFVDHTVRGITDSLPQDIREILATRDRIEPQVVRAMAIGCVRLHDRELFEAVMKRCVANNGAISKYEGLLLAELRQRLQTKP
jgi:spermidine synthase